MSQPSRFSDREKQSQDRQESAYPLLSYFISKYDRIDEMRLQKLCFYADVIHAEEHGSRLTGVEWISVMSGAFSYDIRSALDSFAERDDCETTVLYRRGRTATGYLTAPDNVQTSAEVTEFLDTIHAETKSKKTEDLRTWSKEHPIYETGGVDTPMTFSRKISLE